MSTLSNIFDAVWAALDDYAALTAFLAAAAGKKFKHGTNDKLPVDLTKSDLPALIVSPTTLKEDTVLSGFTGEVISFDIEMHVENRDIDTLFAFVEHVGNALKEKLRGTNANLGLSNVLGIKLSATRFDKHESPDDYLHGRLWSAIRTISVEYYDAIPA